jgi:hypothetical protein
MKGNVLPVVSTVPVVQFLNVITPRSATVATPVPVGRTSPVPSCQLNEPLNERMSTVPPLPKPPPES